MYAPHQTLLRDLFDIFEHYFLLASGAGIVFGAIAGNTAFVQNPAVAAVFLLAGADLTGMAIEKILLERKKVREISSLLLGALIIFAVAFFLRGMPKDPSLLFSLFEKTLLAGGYASALVCGIGWQKIRALVSALWETMRVPEPVVRLFRAIRLHKQGRDYYVNKIT